MKNGNANYPTTRDRIINYLRAGYLSYHLRFWSVVDGLVDGENGHQTQALDPMEAFNAIEELPEKTLILLRDFRLFLHPNSILLRKFKDALQTAKTSNGRLPCHFTQP